MYRLIALLPLALPAAAMAVPFQDVPMLDRAVTAFTGHAIGEEGGARTGVDARLRLAQCPMVSIAWRTDAHDAVVVTCSGPDWRIFVPVNHATPIAAPAAAVAIAPRPDVHAAPVIKRGDPVLIEAKSDSFSISREGIALGDAAPGGRFMVKVDEAKAPVQAIALEGGRATLPGWTQ